MYYRRKVLLALLETFGGRLEKISLQKLLMLVTKLQQKPDFHFVPYKYGCFSFQATADMGTMVKYNQVSEENNSWVKTDSTNYLSLLKETDRKIICSVKQLYGNKNKEDLIRLTYLKYPYYAINSTMANSIMSKEELSIITKSKPTSQKTILFTIGYEGVSLEEYLNKLIINDVKILCDVRCNPQSMKYGFSKSQLQKACDGVGIKYLHFPEVGIPSEQRIVLESQADYDKLFVVYRNTILTKTSATQQNLFRLLQTDHRIALTCFEANIHQCHRKYLSDAISKLPGFDYEIKHI